MAMVALDLVSSFLSIIRLDSFNLFNDVFKFLSPAKLNH